MNFSSLACEFYPLKTPHVGVISTNFFITLRCLWGLLISDETVWRVKTTEININRREIDRSQSLEVVVVPNFNTCDF